jgi:hypothetical protein
MPRRFKFKEQRDGLSPHGVIQKMGGRRGVETRIRGTWPWNNWGHRWLINQSLIAIRDRQLSPVFARRLPRATVLPFARELSNHRSTAARCLPRTNPGRQAGESPRLAAGAARALRRDWQNRTSPEGMARRVGAPRRRREAPERSSSVGACASDGCPTGP